MKHATMVVALMIALVAVISPTPLRADYLTLEVGSPSNLCLEGGKDFSLFHQPCDIEFWATTSSADFTAGPHWAFLMLNPGIGAGINSVDTIPDIAPHLNLDMGFKLPLGPITWSQYWLIQKDLSDATGNFGLSRQWLSLTKAPSVGLFAHNTWTRVDGIQPWLGPYVDIGKIGPLGNAKFALLTNLRDDSEKNTGPGKSFKFFLFANFI